MKNRYVAKTLSIDILRQLISAYDDMKLTCLAQARLMKSPQIQINLIEVAWQCDATIANLEVIIEHLSDIFKVENQTTV